MDYCKSSFCASIIAISMDKENHSEDEKQEEVVESEENSQSSNEEPEEEIRKMGSDPDSIGADTNDSVAFYPKESFAHQSSTSKSRKTLYLIVILVLMFVAAAVFFRSQIKNLVVGQPQPTPAPTATPEPTPTPNPLIRSEWKLEVLNGTTTSGLAKKLADKLKELGYPVVKVGNAGKSSYETTQIFVRGELMEKVDLVVLDLKDIVKIASVAGELTEGTASARIIIGKDLNL